MWYVVFSSDMWLVRYYKSDLEALEFLGSLDIGIFGVFNFRSFETYKKAKEFIDSYSDSFSSSVDFYNKYHINKFSICSNLRIQKNKEFFMEVFKDGHIKSISER